MTDTITLIGLVATAPKLIVTSEGLSISNFRFASAQRRPGVEEGKWVDGDTNWYTITCFRQLAINLVESVQKGQRIIVTGKIRIRDTGDRTGTTVEIEAESIGHDLQWGTTAFTRSPGRTEPTAEGGE